MIRMRLPVLAIVASSFAWACSGSDASSESASEPGAAGAAGAGATSGIAGKAASAGGSAGMPTGSWPPGSSGSGGTGTAGSGGVAGKGTAGSGNAGAGGSGNAGSGNAGSGSAGSASAGSAGSGNAGTAGAGNAGTAGSGNGGSGTAGAAGKGAAGSGAAGAPSGPSEKRIIGYFAAWGVYGRNFHVPDIAADKLTHVNYAFANISDAGECVLGDSYADIDKAYPGDTWESGVLRGSFNQLKVMKQKHPKVKTLISVGGWTWSGRFSDVALTDASRKKFAASCAAFADKYGFDGVDIDWEYPVGGGLPANTYRPEDKQNYTLLLGALREALGPTKLLSIAAPVGPSIIEHLEPAAIAKHVDWINVMSYDFNGPWGDKTGYNAPLYASDNDTSPAGFNIDAAISAYLAAGVPSAKLTLGAPFYGRGFAGVGAANQGLFQTFTGPSTGTWEAGVLDWHDISQNYLPTWTRIWDDKARVPRLFDASKGVMISYDDPQSIGEKTSYVKQKGLGGVMFWELSGDDAQHTLLDAVGKGLN